MIATVFGDDSSNRRRGTVVQNGVVLNAVSLLHGGTLKTRELEVCWRYLSMSWWELVKGSHKVKKTFACRSVRTSKKELKQNPEDCWRECKS